MSGYDEIALAAFGREAMNEICKIYDDRKGNYLTVDQNAIQRVFDRFPNATDEAKLRVHAWAAFMTRQ